MRFLLPILAISSLLFAACGEDDLEFPGAAAATSTPTASHTPGSTTPTPTPTEVP